MTTPITSLLETGVIIPAPSLVYVADDVKCDRIAPGVVLHPGTRLSGAALAIGPDGAIGTEGPAVLHDCQLGSGVTVGSGSLRGCTLLDSVDIGPGAHIRPGCLLEDASSCAHTVGLKQTVLMPHVILGSLINFCDCIMTGGTSRSNHSEVGSSYVHFNYTPHRDKATASLMGDIPHGVMLNQPPIFLGGQGGLVGPVRLAYGTVLAAGTIQRRDVLDSGRLITGSTPAKSRPHAYQPGLYGNIARVLHSNFIYLGNLHALREWYRQVRSQFVTSPASTHCHAGALMRLDELIDERVTRLEGLAERLTHSLDRARTQYPDGLPAKPFDLHQQFVTQWPEIKGNVSTPSQHPGNTATRDAFLADLDTTTDYLAAIKQLTPTASRTGSQWLQEIVEQVAGRGR